ncbi:MAG: terminase large subunit domain-containing protein, partial [Planctomycetaceae bacterium]
MHRCLNRRAAATHPTAFRRDLRLTNDPAALFGAMATPWQESDFCAFDDAWRKLAGQDVEPQFRRAYVERPRGHSKTSDMAMQLAWILQFARQPVHGLAAAADREQAALIRDAVFRIARLNPTFCRDLRFTKFEIANAVTGSRLTVISSDVQSSWGALVDFIICDELCHWDNADLWHSLYSSAAKKHDCILAVLTNAGVGRGWQWDVRETARRSSQWHFSSVEGPAAPWIDETHLEEQRQLLPPPVFDRLWRNLWQHSDGEFVTPAEVEACRDERLEKQQHGQPGVRYFAAIDYAEKHDYTVGVVGESGSGKTTLGL